MIEFNEHIEIQLLASDKVISETLSRIGIANKNKKILFPTCYLYQKDNKVFIYHFKQMFKLINKSAYNNLTDDDIIRRNAIIFCLKNWKLIDCNIEQITPYNKFVFVLPFPEKNEWLINHKFNINALNY